MSADFTLTGGEHNAFHTGLAIPVFSLRTEQSSGVGQFSDLKKLADFAKKTQMDVIQLLPINDTTTFMDWRDSYPYRAISVLLFILFILISIASNLTIQNYKNKDWQKRKQN